MIHDDKPYGLVGLNDCVDLDSLNKAVALLLGHALGNNANENPTMVSAI